MTARLGRPLLALLLALATLAALPATGLAAAPAAPAKPAATASLPAAAVAFAAVHRDAAGHVDAALVGVVAVVVLPENRVKGQTDPRVLATLKSASLAALSQLETGCAYDGTAVGSPVYVNGDPVNLVDPTGHKRCSQGNANPDCDMYVQAYSPAQAQSEFTTPENEIGGLPGGGRWAQKNYSQNFGRSPQNPFSGKSVDDVARALESGELTPQDVPIETATTPNGGTIILNTRSAQALLQARIPMKYWNIRQVQPGSQAASRLATQLRDNGLDENGFRGMPQQRQGSLSPRQLRNLDPEGAQAAANDDRIDPPPGGGLSDSEPPPPAAPPPGNDNNNRAVPCDDGMAMRGGPPLAAICNGGLPFGPGLRPQPFPWRFPEPGPGWWPEPIFGL